MAADVGRKSNPYRDKAVRSRVSLWLVFHPGHGATYAFPAYISGFSRRMAGPKAEPMAPCKARTLSWQPALRGKRVYDYKEMQELDENTRDRDNEKIKELRCKDSKVGKK